MRLPLAIGAVVLGVDIACQTPDSGQVSPVRAVVPMGLRVMVVYMSWAFLSPNPQASRGLVDLKTEAH